MPHTLDANDPESGFPEHDAGLPASRFPWETIPRCLVVAAVLAMIALISWRPAMLRFSQLMFLVSPSHGDSLAWKPEPEPAERPAPRRHTVAPPEWRLAATHFGSWKPERAAGVLVVPGTGDPLNGGDWSRLSYNPWSWQDDTAFIGKRLEAGPVDPDQQPLTAQKTKEGETWPTPPAAAATVPSGPQMPSISPVPLEIPSLPSLEVREAASARAEDGGVSDVDAPQDAVVETAENPEASPNASPISSAPFPGSLLELPPLSFDDIDWTDDDADAESREQTSEEPSPAPTEPIPGMPSPEPIRPADVAADAPNEAVKPGDFGVPGEPAQNVNWAETEITGAIPGAYLTIYPKLKFVGLCVPGQGYIRKYNQVAVPRDTSLAKLSAHDGRTPYGKYYIAARSVGTDGPALVLSWPSPEDAFRIGLPEAELLGVEEAWLGQELPPQETVAGGGVSLDSDRNRVEETDGGFSLEPQHMEEINAALPDGAWVFIQQ